MPPAGKYLTAKRDSEFARTLGQVGSQGDSKVFRDGIIPAAAPHFPPPTPAGARPHHRIFQLSRWEAACHICAEFDANTKER